MKSIKFVTKTISKMVFRKFILAGALLFTLPGVQNEATTQKALMSNEESIEPAGLVLDDAFIVRAPEIGPQETALWNTNEDPESEGAAPTSGQRHKEQANDNNQKLGVGQNDTFQSASSTARGAHKSATSLSPQPSAGSETPALPTKLAPRDERTGHAANSGYQFPAEVGHSLQGMQNSRVFCIGHKEEEEHFSWVCMGLLMKQVPRDLTPKPTKLRLSKMGIETLSQAALEPYKNTLRDFRIQQTGLIRWPNLTRFEQTKILSSIDLDHNKIESLGPYPLNIRAELLNLEFNRIQTIEEGTFNESEIGALSLHGNRALVHIHPNAFANLKNLIKLDLSGTSVAQLPSLGLHNLHSLIIRDNYALKQIPSIYAFPVLEEAHLTYAYHCCSFRYPKTHDPSAHERHLKEQEALNAMCESNRQLNAHAPRIGPAASVPIGAEATGSESGAGASSTTAAAWTSASAGGEQPADEFDGHFEQSFTMTTANLDVLRAAGPHSSAGQTDPAVALSKPHESAGSAWNGAGLGSPFVAPRNVTQIDCGELVQRANSQANISCTPEPDPFNPCEDIMGYSVLRFAVWLVVAASVFGNLSVIFVHLGIFCRLSVPKFLQLNLAIGDLFMGVYLATLAGADLKTKGEYFNSAIDWQHGLGCRLAGASSLFASQLSIFTLSVITFERYYTITYSIDLNMRLQLGWAARIMLVGWIYAFASAMLPIFANINSYSKTSICLPMRTTYRIDRYFIGTLLVVDSLAFLIIFICYLKMYLLILKQKTEATRKERTVAARMALLVSTDFACWAPIIFFGATAVLGHPLISVTNSKILIVFFYPLNSMANPFLYVLTTRQYRRDLNYVAGRWRQWRTNLFKKQDDKLSFSYNNQLHQPYGISQYPVGAQLNAHLGAVAAVTGVANHLRHYKLPLNGHCAVGDGDQYELVNSADNSRQALEPPSATSEANLALGGDAAPSTAALRQQQQVRASPGQLSGGQLLQAGGPGGRYIIRHTILPDKCVAGDGRAFGLSKSAHKHRVHRVHRVLRQRAILSSKREAARSPQNQQAGSQQIQDAASRDQNLDNAASSASDDLKSRDAAQAPEGSNDASKSANLSTFDTSRASPESASPPGARQVKLENYVIVIEGCGQKSKRSVLAKQRPTTEHNPHHRCRDRRPLLSSVAQQATDTPLPPCSLDCCRRCCRVPAVAATPAENQTGSSCSPAKAQARLVRYALKYPASADKRPPQEAHGIRRCSSSGPGTASSSQVTADPATTTTTTETTEQTSTSCMNSEVGIIPKIITTENNGDSRCEEEKSQSDGRQCATEGAKCLCRIGNGRKSACQRRRQSSNSLEVHTSDSQPRRRHQHHNHHRHRHHHHYKSGSDGGGGPGTAREEPARNEHRRQRDAQRRDRCGRHCAGCHLRRCNFRLEAKISQQLPAGTREEAASSQPEVI